MSVPDLSQPFNHELFSHPASFITCKYNSTRIANGVTFPHQPEILSFVYPVAMTVTDFNPCASFISTKIGVSLSFPLSIRGNHVLDTD